VEDYSFLVIQASNILSSGFPSICIELIDLSAYLYSALGC